MRLFKRSELNKNTESLYNHVQRLHLQASIVLKHRGGSDRVRGDEVMLNAHASILGVVGNVVNAKTPGKTL